MSCPAGPVSSGGCGFSSEEAENLFGPRNSGPQRVQHGPSRCGRLDSFHLSELILALLLRQNGHLDGLSLVGALKCYLRELPEPLMTFDLYSDWFKAAGCVDSIHSNKEALASSSRMRSFFAGRKTCQRSWSSSEYFCRNCRLRTTITSGGALPLLPHRIMRVHVRFALCEPSLGKNMFEESSL